MGPLDTHAHLDNAKFADDIDGVIARARAAGLAGIVAVGITADSSARSLDLARAHADVSATVGVHPNEIPAAAPCDWDRIVTMADDPETVGLGETGLDRYWDTTPFASQQEWFARHLELGRRTGLGVVIHCRDAEADMLAMLRAEFDARGPIRGVMHSFSGGDAFARACLEMGLHLSFAGVLTYKNAADLRAVAATLPISRLLVETDCPYLSPVPQHGKRNEPAFVTHTAGCLAGLLGVSYAELCERTTANARELFRRG